MTRGRYRPVLLARPGPGRRVAVAAPWIGAAGRPARARRPARPRARLRPGRPVRPARLRRLAWPCRDAAGPATRSARRVSAARAAAEARGETFYQGPSRIHLAAFPPKERWDDWVELDSRAWPAARGAPLHARADHLLQLRVGLRPARLRGPRRPGQVRKFEGNPEHPGSRGRNCAKGPATLNQVTDPDRILYPLRRAGPRGERPVGAGQLGRGARRARRPDPGRDHRGAAATRSWYHIGRPGEDGFTERVLASWGVDGHNSHTNVCSCGGRTGYQFWMGVDRPSPDHANAKVIYLISSHLETGHYFNPHAQRITEARAERRQGDRARHPAVQHRHPRRPLARRRSRAARRRSTSPSPATCIAHRPLRPRVRPPLVELGGVPAGVPPGRAGHLRGVRGGRWPSCTPSSPSTSPPPSPGIDAGGARARSPRSSPAPGTRFSAHIWRSRGRRQPRRLAGVAHAVPDLRAARRGRHRGRHVPERAGTSSCPRPIHIPPHPGVWQELTWPLEYPLAQNEMSFLLPHFLKEGRGRLDIYFIRVYNPVWTNPDGLSWMEVADRRGEGRLLVALTPTWNESAYFADYVLPMGHGSERHDTHSYEQYDGQWIGFRQPVLRAARERLGEAGHRHPRRSTRARCGRRTSSGSSCPGGSTRTARSASGSTTSRAPGPARSSPSTSTTAGCSSNSVPGLPERAAAEGLTPLEWMRRYGAFEISRGPGRRCTSRRSRPAELADVRDHADAGGCTPARRQPFSPNIVPDRARRTPTTRAGGRSGSRSTAWSGAGFPTPSGRLEFWSSTLAAWGWPEHALPGYIRSHVHPAGLAPGPDGAAVHVPAADPDPHPVGERQVARRARAHQPGVDPPVRRGAARRRPHRRPGAGRDRASATSSRRRGSPRASGRAWSPAATTWAAGGWQAGRAARAA